ncbi:hypothetical protein SLNWT_0021 [Streptomyces albus]|uniref:Thiolase C-terminal domain-containing protein n=1 Tax=Streptomyces albus (strain ATCC 21838 / DSM 41398 / FERM P-419 / JCM 4703 / NBRC 107858) TaxID=1081613 RepID=A0A0B5EQF6_STRA4|nr:hypothetical protein SLNWT_0021 [Streptomyces albus]AOU74712.1 hypothetical protein SLNHY_0021 [Streptomyces albus]AYN30523.1 sterol carrier protein [Streptomyces albus]
MRPPEPGAAIAGLGLTATGKVYGRTATDFAAEAVRLAAADAGLALRDIDGLLISTGMRGDISLELQRDLGLRDLGLLAQMQAFGATAGAMVQLACMAVRAGQADAVACVFADAPLKEDKRAGAAYTRTPGSGWKSVLGAAGLTTPTQKYALAARRHMLRYGTTEDHFAEVAVAQRESALLNPLAQMRTPLTPSEHHASRVIADPFRLYDCCLVSNGGAAVIVTGAGHAADLAQPAVHVLGWGQGHPGTLQLRDDDFGLVTGAARSGARALAMAGLKVADVDVFEIYDCYTYTVLVTLEDYGLCPKGQGGDFVAGGALRPGGSLAVNTGGGQLSSYYLWGMTPLTEAVVQARGHGGARQAAGHDVVMVSGNGGILDHHSTLVLGASR